MYQLEKYSGMNSRHECPLCHDKHSFTYYVDEYGVILDKKVGRCNHESGCGYHYTPQQFFIDNPEEKRESQSVNVRKVEARPKVLCTIPFSYVKRSASYDCDLIRFFCNILEIEQMERIWKDYAVGATKGKDVIYWQIDINGKVRTGKVMKYDPDTGHRIKELNGVNWIHSIMKKNGLLPEDWELTQCLFGEHLLRAEENKSKIVALVESEKTALICSAVYPDYVWLATGGKSQMSIDKMKVLSGRTVIMFPDADGYDDWVERSKSFTFCKVIVSDILEKRASTEEKKMKIDIADWIIKEILSNSVSSVQEELSESERVLLSFEERNPAIKRLITVLDLQLVQ